MISHPSISVVLATYNGGKYLSDQLESIRLQTLLPLEMVVADDGSLDSTLDILNDFARDAPFPVNIIRNSRLGITRNFLSGFARSSGDYVAWSDQDDIWHPEKLAHCAQLLAQEPVALLCHDAQPVDEGLRPLDSTNIRRILRRELSPRLQGDLWWCPPGFATIIDRHLLEGLDFTNLPQSIFHAGPAHHDEIAAILAILSGQRLMTPTTLAQYRQHSTNSAGAPTAVSARTVALSDASFTRRRADVLESWVAFYLPTLISKNDSEGARWLEELYYLHRERASLHESGSRRQKLVYLYRLLRRRGYRSRSFGGLGKKALLLDAGKIATQLFYRGK